MTAKLHTSKDGSSTLYSEEFNQFYHNPNGAVTESLHVFFETSGLIDSLETAESLTILEVGFGTGLNFLLLLDICKRLEIEIPIKFYSIEAFPVDAETAEGIDFRNHLHFPQLNDELPHLYQRLKSGFNIRKLDAFPLAELHLFKGKFDDLPNINIQVDFIFHDPFSPEVNEELWTASTFKKLADYGKQSAVLATYCAASKARGAMAAANWKVARAKGALGKREMTLASLDASKLLNFKRVNEEKLAKRYKNNDF